MHLALQLFFVGIAAAGGDDALPVTAGAVTVFLRSATGTNGPLTFAVAEITFLLLLAAPFFLARTGLSALPLG